MDSATHQRAGRKEWLGLAVLALPTMLIGLDLTVLHLAIPSLSTALQPSSTQLLWITDIYGFLIAGFLITMGRLGDRIGRRRLLMIGGAAFGLTSVLAAYAGSAETLIAARAMLGVAGATLMPSTLSLISNMFKDPKQRAFAIAVWMTNFMVGGAIGPLIGGVLLEHFWWGSVFLIGAPIMALMLVLAPAVLPEYRQPAEGRLDLFSVLLSLAAILPIIYGIKELARDGAGTVPVMTIGVGLAVGVAFVRRQRNLPDPLMDLSLLARRAFSTALGAQLSGLFVIAGMQFLVLQYLQLVLDVPPLRAGLLVVPAMVAGIVGSLLAPAIARRFPHATVIAVSMLLSAIGLVILAATGPDSGLTLAVVGFTVVSLTINPAIALTYDLIIGSAPPERAGSASGMAETGSELGLALGVAVSGSVATAVYRGLVTDSTVPAGVPAHLADRARDTLGGAVDSAAQLPSEVGAELLDVTRAAFTNGLQVASITNAAIAVVTSALVIVLLRRRPGSNDKATAEDEELTPR